jgi:hypothetical protein
MADSSIDRSMYAAPTVAYVTFVSNAAYYSYYHHLLE